MLYGRMAMRIPAKNRITSIPHNIPETKEKGIRNRKINTNDFAYDSVYEFEYDLLQYCSHASADSYTCRVSLLKSNTVSIFIVQS